MSSDKSTPGAVGPKELFYRRYRVWIELEARQGRTREVMMWHHIQGRKLELWKLSEAVLEQECDPDEVNWGRVAQKMGFGETTLVHASEELEGCWDKYLSKYHEDTADFDFTGTVDDDDSGESTEETDDSSEEEEASEEEGVAGGEGAAEEEDVAEEDVSTPRRTDPSPSLSRPRPGSSHRKRRLDRGVEIPASPPSKARRGPAHGANNTTPSKRRRLSTTEGRHPRADSEGDENIYDATPTREPPMREEANHPSPLSVRPRVHRESETPASNAAREQPGRGNGTSASVSARKHNRQSTVTPGPSTAGRHTRNTSAASMRTPTRRSAPKRRALPPAIAHESDPESETPVDDNDDEEDDRDEVQITVDQLVREGYSRDMVIESLYRTSMVPSLSRKVLKSLHEGDGVPENQAGVWTTRDDDELRSVEANINRPTENLTEQKRKRELVKSRDALVRKHGKGDVEVRKKFLADAKEAGLSF